MGSKGHELLVDADEAPPPESKRRSRRAVKAGTPDRIFVDAAVTVSASRGGVRGIACDVSAHGMKLRLEKPLEPGPVSVKLVGLPIVSGEICWSAAPHVGVRLARPIAADVLADWIQHHGSRR
jgi:hypothetical protein